MVYFINPLCFTFIDTAILIAALVRMWKNYKDDPQLVTNEKQIFLHVAMLIIFFLLEFVTYFCQYWLKTKNWFELWTSFHAGYLVVVII